MPENFYFTYILRTFFSHIYVHANAFNVCVSFYEYVGKK